VAGLSEPDRFDRWRNTLSIEPAATVDALFRPDVVLGDGRVDACWGPIADDAAGADELSAFQYLEIRSTLPDELLLYGDKLSMAHGLEARVPFLDQDVIEYALRLPPRLKVRAGTRKWLHREVCRRYLPDAVLRRPKRGFAVDVVDSWYRSSVNGLVADTLGDPQSLLYSVLDPTAVQGLLADHRGGSEDRHKILHSLVVTELWLREFQPSMAS
jgi:asparagine synthase (glutamine-hydrolysing)